MSDPSSLSYGPEKAPPSPVSAGKTERAPHAVFKDPSGDVEGATIIHVEEHDVFSGEDSAVDPVYQAKARVLNAAFQEIGMGKYQVRASETMCTCHSHQCVVGPYTKSANNGVPPHT